MRKMNYKLLAAALVAIQISVTAMPMCAMACETEQAETAQGRQRWSKRSRKCLKNPRRKRRSPPQPK